MSSPEGSPANDGATATLDRLLAEAGSRYRSATIRDLAAGVDAAPAGPDPEAWLRLVAPTPGPALARALESLREPVLEAGVADARTIGSRVAALRAELERRGLAGFVVPRADEHQGEYVPPRGQRLAWITGFTGSAGHAVILRAAAAVFVDGRYTLQAAREVPTDLIEPRHVVEAPLSEWLAGALRPDEAVGYDPWLHTPADVERLRAAVDGAGGRLVAVETNPVDAIWADQPPPPLAPVFPQPILFAGATSAEKRLQIGDAIARKADAAVLAAPDSIAWLLNVRGGDVPCTPFALSFAILHRDGQVDWFVDERKLLPEIAPHLGNGVSVQPPQAFGPALDALVAAGKRVTADPAATPAWVFDRIAAAGGTVVRGDDPVALPKACKNPVEIAGVRAAHRRDGVAVTRFLAWLAGNAPAAGVDELAASARLLALRSEGENFRGQSFETISGAGPNGAIVHYRSSPATNRPLKAGELYLVDSGAQYLDGTTDVTRTIAIGAPGAEMRDRFTRVLKGHIAIATAIFPKGTSGGQLDGFARAALWQAGLDYDHGTGHGVGSYLSVHEGPHRISKSPSSVPLQPGMIVSNEPGYYKTGAYGIRIENLVMIVPVEVPGGERAMLGFETLTLAPIDRHAIDLTLLSPAERAWVDGYHARVRAEIGPLVDPATRDWLVAATRPL
ncbi:MAG: aminopeptidase P family protein [Alphaproteobacteria bacterium]